MTDQETHLWQAFREGDRSAFEALLRTYYQPLYEYGTKFLKDRDQLKDCLHDLLVNLWERRTFLNETENLKLYLFKALRNQIFKEKHKAGQLASLPDWEEGEPEADDYAENLIIQDETTREKQFRVQHLIGRLSKRQREILHLKFYENLSNEQVADLLSISRPAVANLLYQTLKQFRENWHLLFIFWAVF
ncbi:RNA polymerase sigma factor [Larkinella sp. GY13]|uniref:RNA polymerase sigma factor n=1 Tax=Larkinella sp. GY13 TaxID=3453720 RepID=UPI003EE91B4E